MSFYESCVFCWLPWLGGCSMRALQPAAQRKGGLLMPVCGAGAGSGHPAGQLAPWEASWAYSDARKLGAMPAFPPPCPRPCPSPSPGPALLQHGHGSTPAPSETSPRPPAETGVAPEAGGVPHRHSPCPALLSLRQHGGAAGDPGHRAEVRLSLLYMSPSAFKSRVCDLPIRYAKSSKIRNRFQPGNSVTSIFSPWFFFLSSDGVVSGEVVNMPGIAVSPFFPRGGGIPCKYVKRPRSPGDVSFCILMC